MMNIGELLTGRALVTLPGTATATDAAKLMAEQRVGAVLVLGEDDRPAGIFTERDLMVRIVVEGRDPTTATLADHMTTEIFSVSPERRLSDAAREMQQRHIRHLPVIRDDEVIGLLSLRDLLRELLNLKRQEVRALTAYIQGEEEDAVE